MHGLNVIECQAEEVKKRMIRIAKLNIAVVCCLFGLYTNANGQYPGDECVDALFASEGANIFDTSNASPSTPEPDDSMCPGTYLNWNNSPDVWFSFTPLTNDTYTFSTCDIDSFDTSIVLYEGSCSQQIACNGDNPNGSADCQDYYSLIETPLIAGIEYFIRVGGFGGKTGTGTLTIEESSSGGPSNTVYYVNTNNPTPGNGLSWTAAFVDLQDALDVAQDTHQIWIAQGTYFPTNTDGSQDLRDASFRVIPGVEIFGGFLGDELTVGQRDPKQYRVILSGDLNNDDDTGGDNSDNAFHVVTANYTSGPSARLDSVSITRGNSLNNGAGVFVINSSPNGFFELSRCDILDNNAVWGAGIYVLEGGITINRCAILRNISSKHGSGIYSWGSVSISNSLLTANRSFGLGVIYTNAFTSISNCTIVQNLSRNIGGIYAAQGTLNGSNIILWGNNDTNGSNFQLFIGSAVSASGGYNCIQNLYDLPGSINPSNIDLNPRFVDEFGADSLPATGDEDFRLMQRSPCIDAGDNLQAFGTLDLSNRNRFVDDPYMVDTGNNPSGLPVVDIGAFEHVAESYGMYLWSGANSSNYYDSLNWLPNGYPDVQSSVMFDTTAPEYIYLDVITTIDSLFVTSGEVTFELGDNTVNLSNYGRGMRIDPYDLGAKLIVKGPGQITSKFPLQIGGNITFENTDLLMSDLTLEAGTILSFDGTAKCNVIDKGSRILPSGREIGKFTIDGDYVSQGQSEPTGNLVGSLAFDIKGRVQNGTYDSMTITGVTDLSSAIELRWGGTFDPIATDSFDILDVSAIFGNPPLIFNTGLPSNLRCRWSNPTPGLRGGGDEILVETTGPILFDAGQAISLTIAPNEIAVADFDGINGQDVAITVSDPSFGLGDVIVFLNNGSVGDVWQGFTQQTAIEVGIEPLDIQVIDVNNDGAANDLVLVNYFSNTVTILTNDGTGTFTTTNVTIDSGPQYIAVANYVEDGAGLDDIAVACDSNNMSVIQNTTSFVGTSFSHISSLGIPNPADILPGDVNNDKDFDHIILGQFNDALQVIEGDGTGIYDALIEFADSPLPAGSGALEVAFAQLNGDSIEDAVTVNETTGTISVLLGGVGAGISNVGGGLGSASTVSIGTAPTDISVGDFDNDGDDDFIVSVVGDASSMRELMVVRNDSVSTIVLSTGDSFGAGNVPTLVQNGDFNSDGLLDLVAIVDLTPDGTSSSPALSVFLNETAVVVSCPGDIDDDGSVAVNDLLALIAGWGSSDVTLDLDGSGTVDVGDILVIIAAWGSC